MAYASTLSTLLFLLLLLDTACVPASQEAHTPPPLAEAFAYEQTDVNFTVDSSWQQAGILIQDISYPSYQPDHGLLKAYLIQPLHTTAPTAGVLFFHWLGEPHGDRTQFLDEATALAQQGVTSLLLQGYFPWREQPTDGPTDRQHVVDQTIDARRSLDLLLAQPEVDPQRVAYVGHDYGAMYGAILSGLEERIRAYVLITGMGTFSDWSLKYWPHTATAGEAHYRQALASVDPEQFVAQAAPAALLFQFAQHDIYISHDVANAFYEIASQPKTQLWYNAPHDMDLEAARRDRHLWLQPHLNLAPFPTEVVQTLLSP
ncbi:hypothetical protein [Catalinimonas alkaloidigena]|nr:hypothetical protein [Catalinimonas alkaloidigena]